MDMAGQDGTPESLDRPLIAAAVKALMKLERGTRTKAGLTNRAGLGGRMTVDRVLAGKPVRGDTYLALDDALELPPGTLEAIGYHEWDELARMGIRPEAWAVIQRMQPPPDGSSRNSAVS